MKAFDAGCSGMVETTEIKSENARHLILRCADKLYYVNMIRVRLCEGEKMHKAKFHAKSVGDNQYCDLDMAIPQKLYDVLVEYTKLDNSDLILLLSVENQEFKWSLVSESRLKQHSNKNSANAYVV